MRKVYSFITLFALCMFAMLLTSCAASRSSDYADRSYADNSYEEQQQAPDYGSQLPQQIATSEKTIVVDPRVHAWGAYENGSLVKSGLATAGGNWCSDIHRPCRTKVGHFRMYSLGAPGCKSSLYPLPHGGAPMPYCMFFNGNQAIHGSPSSVVVADNVSHGCVRVQVSDAEWIRYNFANVGTKVIVKPY